MPSEAFTRSASPWISPHRLGVAMRDVAATEAVLRAAVVEQDIADNLIRIEPPLTAVNWLEVVVMLAGAAFIGGMLAVQI